MPQTMETFVQISHCIQRAGVTYSLVMFSLIMMKWYDKVIKIKSLILTENTSFYLSATKKKSRKNVSDHYLFCKMKLLSLQARGTSSYLHFVVFHLFYGTPFRLKYCSVVYNVCLIKVCSSSTLSPTSQNRSSVRRVYL